MADWTCPNESGPPILLRQALVDFFVQYLGESGRADDGKSSFSSAWFGHLEYGTVVASSNTTIYKSKEGISYRFITLIHNLNYQSSFPSGCTALAP
jgi:hypothetical protein